MRGSAGAAFLCGSNDDVIILGDQNPPNSPKLAGIVIYQPKSQKCKIAIYRTN